MASLATSHLTSLALWAFLPNFLSSLLLKTYYHIFPTSRPSVSSSSPPALVTRQHQRANNHARRARILLVTLYLGYTILSAYRDQGYLPEANYYSVLGLPRSVVESQGSPAVKSHFRKLARVYHPDKVGPQGQEYFVALRKASETLEDEEKRWAYERFGPGVLDWKAKGSRRDFVLQGCQSIIGFYVFAGASLVLLSFFRKEERSFTYWRTTTYLLTLTLELFLSIRPTPSPLFQLLIPYRLTYQHISLLRQIFLSSSMAFTQLVPLLWQPLPDPPTLEDIDRELLALQTAEVVPILERVVAAESTVGGSGPPTASKLTELAAKQQAVIATIKLKMVDLMADMRLRQDPHLGKVWEEAVVKGREREERKRRAHAGGARVNGKLTPVMMSGGGSGRKSPLPSPVGLAKKKEEEVVTAGSTSGKKGGDSDAPKPPAALKEVQQK